MKKLKRQYQRFLKTGNENKQVWDWFPCIHSGTHKKFSTKQEKSYYFLHLIEYAGYPVKLRAARGKALANPWDDYPSQVYDLAKCWKHNSKRRKQYYR